MIVPVKAAGFYNLFTFALDVVAGTLTFSNVIGCDLEPASLVSVWNITHSAFYPLSHNVTGVTITYSAGLPVYTYTLTNVPAGWANGDTLIIRLQIPDAVASFTVLAYIASKS